MTFLPWLNIEYCATQSSIKCFHQILHYASYHILFSSIMILEKLHIIIYKYCYITYQTYTWTNDLMGLLGKLSLTTANKALKHIKLVSNHTEHYTVYLRLHEGQIRPYNLTESGRSCNLTFNLKLLATFKLFDRQVPTFGDKSYLSKSDLRSFLYGTLWPIGGTLLEPFIPLS